MGERAHGVVDVNCVTRAARHACAGLLVGGVGVPHGHNHPGFACGFDARSSAEELRRDGQNARVAGSGLSVLEVALSDDPAFRF